MNQSQKQSHSITVAQWNEAQWMRVPWSSGKRVAQRHRATVEQRYSGTVARSDRDSETVTKLNSSTVTTVEQ